MVSHLAFCLDAAQRQTQPFPHFVVTQALPQENFAQLAAEFPDDGQIRRGIPPGDNRRFSLPAADALADPHISHRWRETVLAHVSQEFLDAVLAVLAADIRSTYPDLEARVGRRLENWRAGIRGRDDFDSCEVLLDAQICINTPVRAAASSVRGPHVDKPKKLFAGLWYLRADGDDSTGGDLLIYRWRRGRTRFDGAELDPADVEVVSKVPYAGNTLVLFLNSLDALHGVTPRQPTLCTRRFLNLVGEVRVPLFDLKSRQRRLRGLRHVWRRLRDRLSGRYTNAGQRWD